MAKVLNPGLQTIIETWHGRPGYMELGISHSGLMDYRSGCLANLLVGNDPDAPLIEVTAGNFALEFSEAAIVAVTGADFGGKLGAGELPMWRSVAVSPGDRLVIGRMTDDVVGFRQYIAVSGGVDVPEYLGSKSTAIYGGFGGHEGRALKKGDQLSFGQPAPQAMAGRTIAESRRPRFTHDWQLRAIPGPDSAPDFFTEEGMELFFSTQWQTQTLADRSGIRLSGPKPIFAPERVAAGGHPSNITDHGYPGPGCLNVSGDTPILFPREGPTSGGYVCALSVLHGDQWMMGQIIPGRDTISFICATAEEGVQLRKDWLAVLADPDLLR